MKQATDSPSATIQAVTGDVKDKGHFVISGSLVFDTVPDLMKQVNRLFAPFDSVVVDFSRVQHCNSAGLAVILHIAKEMRQQNKSVCFRSLPEQIHTFARAYSIEKELTQSGLLC